MTKLRLSLSGLSRAGSFSSAMKSSSLKDGMNDNILTKDEHTSKGRSRRRLIPPPFRRRKQNVVVTESVRTVVPFFPMETAATPDSSLDRAAPVDQTTTVLSACGASFLPNDDDALRAEVEHLRKRVTDLNDELDCVLADQQET